jgi:hypothetical protein
MIFPLIFFSAILLVNLIVQLLHFLVKKQQLTFFFFFFFGCLFIFYLSVYHSLWINLSPTKNFITCNSLHLSFAIFLMQHK